MRRWLNRRGRGKPWLKVYRKSSHPCPRCGSTIEFSRQAGRVTYHCPECQPRRGGPVGRTQHLFLP
jgi:formamidopyrimidine-DNA glycosylase